MRYFNTSGPNVTKDHYTLMRPELVAEGLDKVHKDRYFTISTPTQTGKSNYSHALANALKLEGYQVCYISFKNLHPEKNLIHLKEALFKDWGISFLHDTITTVFQQITNTTEGKCVLILDDIDNITTNFLDDILLSIRAAYHSRNKHCLKSVILLSVNNVLSLVKESIVPFNIADNLDVPLFTIDETFELLTQHETETGQIFDPSVKNKIAEITANQPGLVNGFAAILVKNAKGKPLITYDDYLVAEDWYINKSLDKNIANIINKAKKYQNFVERLLFTDDKVPFQIYKDNIKELHANGIITYDNDTNVIFHVPLYKKCLYTAFYPYMNGEIRRVRGNMEVETFLKADGQLDMDKIITSYKAYAQRKGFRYFREKDANGNYISLKEAALMYSFDTYINALIGLVGGKTYLEPQVALGRSDMIIYANGYEYVVETKVYSDTVQFADGKKQLAYYIKGLNLTTGVYLVFVRSTITNPKVIESTQTIEGVEIKTHIVRYDLKTDFTDKIDTNQDEDD
jgi:hypothetical protein